MAAGAPPRPGYSQGRKCHREAARELQAERNPGVEFNRIGHHLLPCAVPVWAPPGQRRVGGGSEEPGVASVEAALAPGTPFIAVRDLGS